MLSQLHNLSKYAGSPVDKIDGRLVDCFTANRVNFVEILKVSKAFISVPATLTRYVQYYFIILIHVTCLFLASLRIVLFSVQKISLRLDSLNVPSKATNEVPSATTQTDRPLTDECSSSRKICLARRSTIRRARLCREYTKPGWGRSMHTYTAYM